MKHRIRGLTIALVIVFCTAGSGSLRAQDARKSPETALDRPVSLNASNEPLADVLNDLAKKGKITLSYQSDILPKDKTVTLKIRDITIEMALKILLGKGYEFSSADDFVVIRQRSRVKAKAIKSAVKPSAPDEQVAGKMVLSTQKLVKAKKPRFDDEGDTINLASLEEKVREIIAEMVADGLVKDKDSFSWFGLDDGQFLVDGRPMADSLRLKYAQKYVGADGNGYYYGPVSSLHGHGYFFDKKEIFGTLR